MKMNWVRYVIALVVLAVAVYAGSAALTHAENEEPKAASSGGRVVVVDVPKLLIESKAGQHIQEQLKAKREAFAKELEKKDKELKKTGEALANEKDKLSQEEFLKKRKEFESSILKARQEAAQNKAMTDQAGTEALKTLHLKMLDVVAEMGKKERYALVLNKKNVLLVEKSMDVTGEVMKNLDSSLKKVDVKFEDK